jgi:3-phytase
MNARTILGALAAIGMQPAAAQSETEANTVRFSIDEDRALLVAEHSDGTRQEYGPLAHTLDGICYFSEGGRTQVFLPDGDGALHHYVADSSTLLYLRAVHANPDTEVCDVDPSGEWLYFLDPATGLWRTPTSPELEPMLTPVELLAPWGRLPAGTETIPQPQGRLADTDRMLPTVVADAETAAVRMRGDVADDPAVLVNPVDAAQSLILGADKAEGLRVYGLDGKERQFLDVGRLNNVDVAIVGGGERKGVAVASNRTHRRVDVFEIELATARVSLTGSWPLELGDPYGICMTGGEPIEVFVGDTEGRVQRWRLDLRSPDLEAELVEEMRFSSQTEGCDVDAANGILYVGEEDVGIWHVPLEAPATKRLLVPADGEMLVADVEGITLIDRAGDEPWLLASSQGDDSYIVVDPGTGAIELKFRIGLNLQATVDGVSETDGIDLVTQPLPGYPRGLLVVQDGRNVAPPAPQNFKLVSWASVESLMR